MNSQLTEQYLKTNDLDIRLLADHESSLWDVYIKAHSHGTLYHLSAWRKAIEKTYICVGMYYIAFKNKKICGVAPIFVLPTLFSGRKAVSIPYGMYGGILGDTPEIENKLHDYVISISKEKKCNHLELRYLHNPNLNLPKNELYVTFIKPLEKSPEDILKSIPRKSRASIRNGYDKFNLKVSHSIDLDLMYRLYSLNKRNLGSPVYPKAFFRYLISEFGNDAAMLTIMYNNIPVSCVLYFWFKDTVVPYFSGGDKTYYKTNANNLMYYELMKYASERGVSNFDFGRSRKDTGAAEFKENMGFTPQQLHYYYHMNKPGEIPNISPSNSNFHVVTKAWTKLPVFVANIIGPQLVRYIP